MMQIETVFPVTGYFEKDDQHYSPHFDVFNSELYDTKKKDNGVVCEAIKCESDEDARDVTKIMDDGCYDFQKQQSQILEHHIHILREYRLLRMNNISDIDISYFLDDIRSLMMEYYIERHRIMTRSQVEERLRCSLIDKHWCMVSYDWHMRYEMAGIADEYTFERHCLENGYELEPEKEKFKLPTEWASWWSDTQFLQMAGMWARTEQERIQLIYNAELKSEQAFRNITIFIWESLSKMCAKTDDEHDHFWWADHLSQLTGRIIPMLMITPYFNHLHTLSIK